MEEGAEEDHAGEEEAGSLALNTPVGHLTKGQEHEDEADAKPGKKM